MDAIQVDKNHLQQAVAEARQRLTLLRENRHVEFRIGRGSSTPGIQQVEVNRVIVQRDRVL